MTRHNYKFRPKPKWEDGFFVPSTPIPMPKPLEDWTTLDFIDSVVAMSENPITASTDVTMTEDDMISRGLGQTLFIASSPEAIRHIFIKNAENYRMQPVRQSLLKPALRDGLLVAEGEDWSFARRALSPIFTPRHIGQFPAAMQHATNATRHKCNTPQMQYCLRFFQSEKR